MKKVIVFLMVVGFTVFGYIKTKSFTYLNGELTDEASAYFQGFALCAVGVAICYLVSGIVRQHVYKNTSS